MFVSYLLWDLSKIADKSQDGALDERVANVVHLYLIAVEIGVEDVHGLHCSRALLLEAEDQIDPVVEVAADVIAFQGLKPNRSRSVAWRAGRPPMPSHRGWGPARSLHVRYITVASCVASTTKHKGYE